MEILNTNQIIENLLYLPIDLPNPPTHELQIFKDISVEKFWRDKFRTCWGVPLYTDHEEKGVYKWSPLGNKAPELKAWIEEHILPMTGGTRITFIVTPPGDKNAPHIDCSPEKFETIQHKFRFVMEGNVDDLVFLGKNDARVRPPNFNNCFMMAGNWPHEMENTHSGKKFTLAVGSPWEPDSTDLNYSKLISRSYDKFKDYYISKENMELVDNWREMFEDYKSSQHDIVKDYWNSDKAKDF